MSTEDDLNASISSVKGLARAFQGVGSNNNNDNGSSSLSETKKNNTSPPYKDYEVDLNASISSVKSLTQNFQKRRNSNEANTPIRSFKPAVHAATFASPRRGSASGPPQSTSSSSNGYNNNSKNSIPSSARSAARRTFESGTYRAKSPGIMPRPNSPTRNTVLPGISASSRPRSPIRNAKAMNVLVNSSALPFLQSSSSSARHNNNHNNNTNDDGSVGDISMASTTISTATSHVTASTTTAEVSILQKRLADANMKLKTMQSKHKEDRLQWKAAHVELDRVKRERERLLEDQAEQRRELQAAKDREEEGRQELKQITAVMNPVGSIEGVLTAISLRSQVEALVNENAQLKRQQTSLESMASKSHQSAKQMEAFRHFLVTMTRMDITGSQQNHVQKKHTDMMILQKANDEFFDKTRELLKKAMPATESETVDDSMDLLQTQYQERVERFSQLLQKNDKWKQMTVSQQTEIDQLKVTVQTLQVDKENDDVQHVQAIEKVQEALQTEFHSKLEEEQALRQSDQEEWKVANENLNQQLSTLTSELERVKSSRKEAESSWTQLLEAERKEKETKLQTLQTTLDETLASKEEHDKYMSDRMQTIKATNDELMSQLKASQEDAMEKEQEIESLRSNLEEMTKLNETNEKTAAEKVDDLLRQKVEWNDQLLSLECECVEHKEAIETLQKELEDIKETKENDDQIANDKIHELEEAKKRLTSQLETSQEENVKRGTDIERLQASFVAIQTAKDTEEKSAAETIRVLEESNLDLNSQLQTSNDRGVEKETEIQKLKDELTALKQSNEEESKTLANQIDTLLKSNDEVNAQLETLKEEIAQKVSDLDKLQTDIDDLKALKEKDDMASATQLDDLRDSNTELETSIQKLKQDHTQQLEEWEKERDTQMQELNDELKQSKGLWEGVESQLKQQLSEEQEKSANSEKEVQRLQSDLEAMKAAFDRDLQNAESTRQELQDRLASELSTLRENIADLTSKLDAYKEKETQWETDRRELSKTTADQQEQIKMLQVEQESAMVKSSETLATLQKEMDELKKAKESEMNEAIAKSDGLSQTIDKLKSQLLNLQKDKEEQSAAFERQNTEQEQKYSDTIATLQNDMEELKKAKESEMNEAIANSDSLSRSMDDMKSQLSSLEKVKEEQSAELESQIADQKQKYDETIATLQNDMEELKKAKESEMADVIAKSEGLSQTVEELNSELSSLQKAKEEQAAELKRQNADQEKRTSETTATLQNEIDELKTAKESELSDATAKSDALSQTIEDMKSQLSSLQKEKDEQSSEHERQISEQKQKNDVTVATLQHDMDELKKSKESELSDAIAKSDELSQKFEDMNLQRLSLQKEKEEQSAELERQNMEQKNKDAETIATLQNEIDELKNAKESEMSDAIAKSDGLSQTIEDLNSQFSSLQQEKEEQSIEFKCQIAEQKTSHSETIETLRNDMDGLKKAKDSELSDAIAKSKVLSQTIDEMNSQLSSLQKEKEEQAAELERQATAQKNKDAATIATLQNEIDELNKAKESEMNDATAKSDALSQTIEDMKSQLSSLQKEKDERSAELERHMAEQKTNDAETIATLQNGMDELKKSKESEVSDAMAKSDGLSQTVDDLTSQLSSLKKEKEEQSAELERQNTEQKNKDAQTIATLQNEIDELKKAQQSEMHDAIVKSESLSQTIEDLNSQLSSLQQEKEGQSAKLERLHEEQKQNYEETIETLRNDMGELKKAKESELSDAIAKSDGLKKTVDDLNSRLSSIQKEKDEQATELRSLNEEQNAEQQKNDAEMIATLQKDLEELQHEMEWEKSDALARSYGLSQTVEDLNSQLSSLQKSSEEHSAVLERQLVEQKKNSDETIANLQSALDDIKNDKESRLSDAVAKAEGMSQEVEDLHSQLSILQQEREEQSVERELQTMEQKQNFTETIESLRDYIKELQKAKDSKLSASIAKSNRLSQTVEDLNSKLSSLQKENEEQAAELGRHNTGQYEEQQKKDAEKITTLQNDLDELKHEMECERNDGVARSYGLSQTVEDLNSQIASLQKAKEEQSVELERHNTEQKEEIATLQTEVEELKGELSKLSGAQEKAEKLEKDLANLEDERDKALKEEEKKREALEEVFETLAKTNQTLEDENSKLSKGNEKWQRRSQVLEETLQLTEEAATSMEDKMERDESEQKQIRADLTEAESRVKSLQKKLDETHQTAALEQAESANEMSDLRAQLEEARSQIAALEEQNALLLSNESSSSLENEKSLPRSTLGDIQEDDEEPDVGADGMGDIKPVSKRRGIVEPSSQRREQQPRASIANFFGMSREDGDDLVELKGLSEQVETLTNQNQRLEKSMARMVSWNDELLDRNDTQMEKIDSLEKMYKDLKARFNEKEKKYKLQLGREQTSMAVLFKDLSANREALVDIKEEGHNSKKLDMTERADEIDSTRNLLGKKEKHSRGGRTKYGDKDSGPRRPLSPRRQQQQNINPDQDQGKMLKDFVGKKPEPKSGFFGGLFRGGASHNHNNHSSVNTASSTTINDEDGDHDNNNLNLLAEENKKLNSNLVSLQTKHREEAYNNQKLIERLKKENEELRQKMKQ